MAKTQVQTRLVAEYGVELDGVWRSPS
jgi:hypothetical protein